MTSKDSDWIYDHQGHQAYVPGDLAKANIAHIAPSDAMTSIVQQGKSFGSCRTPTPSSVG